jgi:hypothetical protein
LHGFLKGWLRFENARFIFVWRWRKREQEDNQAETRPRNDCSLSTFVERQWSKLPGRLENNKVSL